MGLISKLDIDILVNPIKLMGSRSKISTWEIVAEGYIVKERWNKLLNIVPYKVVTILKVLLLNLQILDYISMMTSIS